MEKLKMESIDMTQKNIEKIEALFPNVITEIRGEDGSIKKGINFELLKQELSGDIVDGEECYDFTWVGKKAAIVEGNTPIRKTLRPCLEESKDWEKTGNLYIEGDNLEVLKLLQESYLGAIKMIYIDPPYNTGNDFIYKDKYTIDKDEYEEQLGLFDDFEMRLFKNTEANGRFHSDWCSMLYPRIKLAYNLLQEDGVIFISIDDNEVENLKKICNEVFGEFNFVASIIWRKKYGLQNDARWFSVSHDYILVYSKNKLLWKPNLLPRTDEATNRYKNLDNDPRGPWKSTDFSRKAVLKHTIYDITLPSGRIVSPPQGRSWLKSHEEFLKLVEDNRIWFGASGDAVPSLKRYLSEVKDGMTCSTFWDYTEVGHTDKATKDLSTLFGSIVFDYPKPVDLIKRCVMLSTTDNDLILDFFSGSSTTAHAVMQINIEDKGTRKYIMVQLPEAIEETNDAYQKGYKNICEIGKDRIRRAGENILNENRGNVDLKNIDVGFRVLKADSTNMKDVYYAANEYSQNMLVELESNIKEDRTDLDLLYGVLLDWGIPLSLKHDIEEIDGTSVHIVDKGTLIACFADKISENVVNEIAKRQPLRVVFRDSSFANSPDKINVEEIFKLLAPNTSVRVT